MVPESSHIVDNPEFIQFVQVAKESADIKQMLESILKLNSFHRKSALNTWLHQLHLQRAPQHFITSLSWLLDDKIAAKTLKILQE